MEASTRRLSREPLSVFINSIKAGAFDDGLADIDLAVRSREADRKAKLDEVVKTVYGPDAYVSFKERSDG